MMPAVLIILTIHIIIAIRWMLIKILSAVINDWERIKVIVSGGCCLDINIIRKMDLKIKILSLSYFKEVLPDLFSVITIGLADVPDRIRQQHMAFCFLRFVLLPLFVFLICDLLHRWLPRKTNSYRDFIFKFTPTTIITNVKIYAPNRYKPHMC